MQEGLKGASQMPLTVVKNACACRSWRSARWRLATSTQLRRYGGRVAAVRRRWAVNNVLINLGGIKDEEFVARMRAECEELTDIANQHEATGQAALMAR